MVLFILNILFCVLLIRVYFQIKVCDLGITYSSDLCSTKLLEALHLYICAGQETAHIKKKTTDKELQQRV